MTNPNGTPIWYELQTTDADAAQAFYAAVVGWTIAPPPIPGTGDYRVLTAPDGLGVGGLMARPAAAPMAPGWYGYIGVDDVDATAQAIGRLGGRVLIAPQDIPGVGRFAFATDPQGLAFYVMRGDSPDDSKAFGTAPGHCGWNELVTTDHEAALRFYGDLFGWENHETMSMGPMGDYRFVDHAGQRLGAMMTAGAGWPTRWSHYFTVPSIATAAAAVEANGGTVRQGPHEVPGGAWIIHGSDPQGIAFALSGGR